MIIRQACIPMCGAAAPACQLGWFPSPCICEVPATTLTQQQITGNTPQTQQAPNSTPPASEPAA